MPQPAEFQPFARGTTHELFDPMKTLIAIVTIALLGGELSAHANEYDALIRETRAKEEAVKRDLAAIHNPSTGELLGAVAGLAAGNLIVFGSIIAASTGVALPVA